MRALLLPAMGLALLLAVPVSAQAQAVQRSAAPIPPALRAAVGACSGSSARCEQQIRDVVRTLSGGNKARQDQLYIGALQALKTSLPANSPVLVQVAANILPDISEENRGIVQTMASPPITERQEPVPVS